MVTNPQPNRGKEAIEKVPSTIKDLSTTILSKEDKSYLDKYLNLEKGDLKTPYRIRSIQKLGPKIWKMMLGMITIPTLTKAIIAIVLMALIMPS